MSGINYVCSKHWLVSHSICKNNWGMFPGDDPLWCQHNRLQTTMLPLCDVFFIEQMNHTSKQIIIIKRKSIIHSIGVVSCPQRVVIKTLLLLTAGWLLVAELIIIDFSVLDSDVVVLVGETFSGVVLLAPRWVVGEGVGVREEKEFEQPYSSILRQNPPRLYAVG